jgi:hypothetical protein
VYAKQHLIAQSCKQSGLDCTYFREGKKRGRKSTVIQQLVQEQKRRLIRRRSASVSSDQSGCRETPSASAAGGGLCTSSQPILRLPAVEANHNDTSSDRATPSQHALVDVPTPSVPEGILAHSNSSQPNPLADWIVPSPDVNFTAAAETTTSYASQAISSPFSDLGRPASLRLDHILPRPMALRVIELFFDYVSVAQRNTKPDLPISHFAGELTPL